MNYKNYNNNNKMMMMAITTTKMTIRIIKFEKNNDYYAFDGN